MWSCWLAGSMGLMLEPYSPLTAMPGQMEAWWPRCDNKEGPMSFDLGHPHQWLHFATLVAKCNLFSPHYFCNVLPPHAPVIASRGLQASRTSFPVWLFPKKWGCSAAAQQRTHTNCKLQPFLVWVTTIGRASFVDYFFMWKVFSTAYFVTVKYKILCLYWH